VNSGGCNGFQYEFALESGGTTGEDTIFEQDGARIVVDAMSIEYLSDCEVDYEEELIRAGFKVAKNTLADSACGCGSSFNVVNF
jgi:iron-sulfur cluster assembly accessory protein